MNSIISFIFFCVFFRISLLHSNLYLSLIVSFVVMPLFFYKKVRVSFVRSLSLSVILCFIFLCVWSFAIDLLTGNIFTSISTSFFFRLISMLLLSIIPAFAISEFYLKGNDVKLVTILKYAFLLQTIFWFLSYFSPEVKTLLYSLMGASGSTNLNESNMGSRGFGLSNEINYTTPFIMVFIALSFFKNILYSAIISITQLFNSNMVLFSILLSFIKGKINIIIKLMLIIIAIFLVITVAVEYLPRLKSEINSGGLRTVTALWEKHVFFLGSNSFDWLFGNFRYIYHKQDTYSSDIGWIILLNYGGLIFISGFVFLLLNLCFKCAIDKLSFVLWFLVALLLNTKGVLLGPNAFIFFTFLTLFHKYKGGRGL
jgi:hypothetical protein